MVATQATYSGNGKRTCIAFGSEIIYSCILTGATFTLPNTPLAFLLYRLTKPPSGFADALMGCITAIIYSLWCMQLG